MKILSIVLIAIIGGFLLIQIFPGEKPETNFDNPGDIHKEMLINPEVSQILKTACYDCHSNESRFPWYANIAPVSWLVIHDINEGRGELNFSEWATYSPKRKKHKLDEVGEEVEEGEMPMSIYTWTHREADLTNEQRDVLIKWAKQSMLLIEE